MRVAGRVCVTVMPAVGICAVLNLPSYFGLSFHIHQFAAFLYGLALASVFSFFPLSKGKDEKRVVQKIYIVSDVTCFVLSLSCFTYLSFLYDNIMKTIGLLQPQNVLVGCVAVLLTLEGLRRTVGYVFVSIVIAAILSAIFLSYLPVGLQSVPWRQLSVFLFADPQGIIGDPVVISTSLILAFVLFGQVVSRTGLTSLFGDLSAALFGRYRGGQGKVAVVASSLFGMISGSAVANVVTTGSFTIPSMIGSGFPPYLAAAVEAVSSTGGQLMPPIMGAAAFIMASFLGVPYRQVALVAFVPALLYYLAIFIQLDCYSAKTGLKGMPKEQLPRLRNIFKIGNNWLLLVPFFLLIVMLFVLKIEATYAGVYSLGVAMFVGIVLKRMKLPDIAEILASTGKFCVDLVITCGGAGVLIGVLSITGLAYSFSDLLVKVAHGNLFLLLILIALGAIVLGMGMPATGSYLLMGTLAAPALVQMGVPSLAAHLFVFYFAVLSFLTPPVCLAVYAACSLAGSKLWPTALNAIRLGIAAYVVPFAFVYDTSILLSSSHWYHVLYRIMAVALGISFLSTAFEGYLIRKKMGLPYRAILGFGGILCLTPFLAANVTGIGLGVGTIFAHLLLYRGVNYE